MACKRIGIALVCLLLLNGCAVQFVYNQLDWLVPWYLSDYMELEGEQEELFEERLQAYLKWHRHHELPRYSEFLNNVAERTERGLTEQDLDYIQDRTEAFAEALIQRLMPDMLDLFAQASDEQLQDLFKQFEKDNQEFREKFVEAPESKQRRQRKKEVLRYIERWTGRLNEEQIAAVEKWADEFELMGAELESSRALWQQEFERVLALRAQRPKYDQEFVKLIENPEFGRSQALQEKFDRNADLLTQLYLELSQSITEKQKKKMAHKLRSYAQDFAELSGQK